MKPRKSASRRDKPVADVAKPTLEHVGPSLRDYWEVGGEAMELPRTYGESQIRQFAKTRGITQGMVHACLKFRQLWPARTDLDRVVRRGLLFSHIRELSHDRLTPKQREGLERFVEKERPSIRAFRAKVRKLIKGQPRPKKQSRRYKDLGDI